MKPNDKASKIKIKYDWLEMPDEIRNSMTEKEKQECIDNTLKYWCEMMEMIHAGMWVRYAGLIYKLPLCHDHGGY